MGVKISHGPTALVVDSVEMIDKREVLPSNWLMKKCVFKQLVVGSMCYLLDINLIALPDVFPSIKSIHDMFPN